MKRNKKVAYLVIWRHGHGSDHYLFTTREKAEKFMKELKDSDDFEPEKNEYMYAECLELR